MNGSHYIVKKRHIRRCLLIIDTDVQWDSAACIITSNVIDVHMCICAYVQQKRLLYLSFRNTEFLFKKHTNQSLVYQKLSEQWSIDYNLKSVHSLNMLN